MKFMALADRRLPFVCRCLLAVSSIRREPVFASGLLVGGFFIPV